MSEQNQEINLTLREIRDSLKSLNVISKKEGLPFKLNYRVAKISNNLVPIVKAYETALRKFIKENGVINEKTKEHEIPANSPVIKSFNEMNDELLNEENKIELVKIPVDLFLEQDITAECIRSLLWLIDGEPE